MNYLAHAYLSFNNPEILAGNMMSDYIKGKKQYDYPPAVQKGIKLHRLIDQFTDSHAATQDLKSFFRPHYRLYSGAFADVVYDHFLANDRTQFSGDQALEEFSAATYHKLGSFSALFPPTFEKMFPYMKEQDWLYNYRLPQGMAKSFGGLVRRSAYLTDAETAFEIFTANYQAMQACYDNFFPDLIENSFNHLHELLNS
jgi:acyl carrier protein phosphodiesterase